jgi:hypothetical protein
VLPGLMTHRGPILTIANWSGQWPGLVGLLNLNASLTKAGVRYSTLWSEEFTDAFFEPHPGRLCAGQSGRPPRVICKGGGAARARIERSVLWGDLARLHPQIRAGRQSSGRSQRDKRAAATIRSRRRCRRHGAGTLNFGGDCDPGLRVQRQPVLDLPVLFAQHVLCRIDDELLAFALDQGHGHVDDGRIELCAGRALELADHLRQRHAAMIGAVRYHGFHRVADRDDP